MSKVVCEVVRAIEADLKPKLRSTPEHKGFALGLSEVLTRLGPDSVVFDPNEPGTIEVLPETRSCPDCGAVLKKKRAELAGTPCVAWVCECDPDDIDEEEDH